MKQEQYKDIIGYEGLYQISNYGNVRNVKTGRILKGNSKTSYCYTSIDLLFNKKRKSITIHRLVGIHFIPNPDNKPEINHIDGNKKNNHVDNLEWVTSKENSLHSVNVLKRIIKPVIQMDLSGNVIKVYNCLKEACIENNIHYNNLSDTCRGRYKTAGGYKWSYT